MSTKERPCTGLKGEDKCPNNGTKEPWSSYCAACIRRNSRLRYRKLKAEQGKTVYGLDEMTQDLAEAAEQDAAFERDRRIMLGLPLEVDGPDR